NVFGLGFTVSGGRFGGAGAGPANSPVSWQRSDMPRASASLTRERFGGGASGRSGALVVRPHPMRSQLSLAHPTGPQAATGFGLVGDGSSAGRSTIVQFIPPSTVSAPRPLPAHSKPKRPATT